MKVLFAVSNEEISESIVKKYQKEYKQIISYKNVYYFNAILKELQKGKTYDRVVISEDLESFTHTQYDQIDKFIFEKLDSISDEASNSKGEDIPIIVICSDRRAKSEQILVKLFGIGIYNAIIGNDRSVDEVCRLINRPRLKKEAKTYYKIDIEEVNYQAENENDVSEMEIQNILAHYKRLGKNEDRYIDSFNNIAAQYNDIQLRIIIKFLPLNARAVLEEKSQKYQEIMSFNNTVSDALRTKTQKDEEEGPSEVFLKTQKRDMLLSKTVVIPSAMNINESVKLTKPKPVEPKPVIVDEERSFISEEKPFIEEKINENSKYTIDEIENALSELANKNEEETDKLEKRGRGRPKKGLEVNEIQPVQPVKRGRGRPKKNVVLEETILPGLEEKDIIPQKVENILPGIETEVDEKENIISQKTKNILPGLENEIKEVEKNNFLPGFETIEDINENHNNEVENINRINQEKPEKVIDFESILTPDKKFVTFVGTSKNGTSFIVNNLAEVMSSMGINTAILDTTKNRNSYYIYTKNEEQLRNKAEKSIDGLVKGYANGINVNKNLTVYTSLPENNEAIVNVEEVLETIIKNHTLVLIDSDFDTPLNYFKYAQENYLVQTMDILTIQPLTAFLRLLKAKNILEERKLKIILNKTVKIRGIKDETIIGGMAFYNDPAMSYMTELFDRDRIKYVSIPFEEETYIKYLESIIECEISLKGYSKGFMQTLRELANMVYPIATSKNNSYRPPSVNNESKATFNSNINTTLDKMKKSY